MKNKTLNFLKIVLSSIAILILGFLFYTSNYYRADETAVKLLDSDNVSNKNEVIEINNKKNVKIGIIFYPGAKVEYTSYLPILNKLSNQTDAKVFLIKMPFNLAVLNPNAANNIIEDNKDIKKWYIAGHSMGGAMASKYASNHKEKIEGLILLGAYIYGDYPEEKTLTIYGEYNSSVKKKIDYSKNIVEIKGGNHAQFGNYGKQKGDEEARIKSDEQQDIAIDNIVKFINNK